MAVDTTFNSIISEIQLSNLNFAIQLTPFAAYITLKKSVQVDLNGCHASPAQPVFLLLQKSYRELTAAQEEVAQLRSVIYASEQKCSELTDSNASLLLKLEAADRKLEESYELNRNLEDKLKIKNTEFIRLETIKKECENKMKVQRTEYDHFIAETNIQIKSLNKTVKNKEKEIHNLNKHLENSRS